MIANKLSIVGRYAVRLMAILLFLMSLRNAWAGVYQYQGERAAARNNSAAALEYFEHALRINPFDLSSLRGASQNAKSLRSIDQWEANACKLHSLFPSYARSALSCAQAKIHKFKSAGVPENEWSEVLKMIDEAIAHEPGSGAIPFESAQALLVEPKKLSASDKSKIIDWLSAASAVRWPDQTSVYLKPSIEIAFNHARNLGHSFADLSQRITPDDYVSYAELIRFIDLHSLWKARQEIWPRYSALKEAAYLKLQTAAVDALRLGKRGKASVLFKRLSWMKPDFLFPSAGLLATADNRPGDDTRILLKRILEEEDEDLSAILPFLNEAVKKSEDPYITGIFAYKTGRFSEARNLLKEAKPEEKHLRRYLALANRQEGRLDESVKLLLPSLNESASDARELFLLKNWVADKRETVEAKITAACPAIWPAAAWSGKGVTQATLHPRKKGGMIINLLPTAHSMKINLRFHNTPDAKDGLVKVRLHNHLVATQFFFRSGEHEIKVPIKTTGGKRWLEVEFTGKETAGDFSDFIELGTVEIS